MRFLIIIFFAYLAYQFLRGLLGAKGGHSGQQPKIRRSPTAGEDLVEDPYCHTYVPISNACKTSFDGKFIYFCSKKCQEAYNASRDKTT